VLMKLRGSNRSRICKINAFRACDEELRPESFKRRPDVSVLIYNCWGEDGKRHNQPSRADYHKEAAHLFDHKEQSGSKHFTIHKDKAQKPCSIATWSSESHVNDCRYCEYTHHDRVAVKYQCTMIIQPLFLCA
jgi:hypothetical protein